MSGSASFSGRHYTFERDNRELQRRIEGIGVYHDYTFERDNRELQLLQIYLLRLEHYTFERDNRELQPKVSPMPNKVIIPLREIIGNYNIR